MSLVTLISADLSLKRTGKDYTGLCPFHAEKTPSFTVAEDKGFFYCFGCGAHGDEIDWLRKVRGLTYQDACKQVGKELTPDPWFERRKQIKVKLEWDYWTWRRALWRELLSLDHDMRLEIQIAEAAYRSVLRAPALWTDQEQTDAIETLSALYDRREIVQHQLDVLQSPRHEQAVQAWWRSQCD